MKIMTTLGWLTLSLLACGDKPDDDDSVTDDSDQTGSDDDGSSGGSEPDHSDDDDDGSTDSGSGDAGDTGGPVDADGDGVDEDDDCDDTDAAVYPGATEVCDGNVDHDCDGAVDQNCMGVESAGLIFEAKDEFDMTGWSHSVGDLSGDGLDDLVVGTPRAMGQAGGEDRGRLDVWSGPLTPGTHTVSDGDAELKGRVDDDFLGWEVSIVPDMDGDGIGDLVTSSFPLGTLDRTGEVMLFFGPVTGTLQLSDSLILAAESGDDPKLGRYVVTSAGDVTGDGLADLIVGAPESDEGVNGGGAVYIFAGPITSAMAFANPTATVTGNENNDFLGTNYAGGDFNGDGIDDALFGAYYANETVWKDGTEEAWLFHGPLTGTRNGWDADAVVPGRGLYENWSADVGAGDWNGDGWLDWAIGAPNEDEVNASGAVHIVLGPVSGRVSSEAVSSSILGTANTERLGDYSGMIMGEDLDVDGRDELIIGARWHGTNGLESNGAVAVFYGLTSGTLSLEDADLKLLGAESGGQLGCELDVGDVDHDGLPDLLVGAFNTDIGGEAYVVFGWQL